MSDLAKAKLAFATSAGLTVSGFLGMVLLPRLGFMRQIPLWGYASILVTILIAIVAMMIVTLVLGFWIKEDLDAYRANSSDE